MSHYLTDLADVLRAAGLVVSEERGLSKVSGSMIDWPIFGRSSNSQYVTGRPTAVMNHHTVSKTAPANDVNYCNVVSDIRPLTNLIIVRDGTVHVCAGGPTNTNGSGKDTWGGGVPENDMNRYAIGIEITNLGNGRDPYPEAQQNAVMDTNVALCQAYNISPNSCRAHFEWAPGRKIDPKGPSRWAPGGGLWDMDAFRAEVESELEGEEDDMKTQYVWRHKTIAGAFWVCDGSVVHLDGDMLDDLRGKGVREIVSDNNDVADSYKRVARGL